MFVIDKLVARAFLKKFINFNKFWIFKILFARFANLSKLFELFALPKKSLIFVTMNYSKLFNIILINQSTLSF
jgi:hypothetical protein